MGRGGARPGSGRKGKTQAEVWLGGDAGKRGKVSRPALAPLVPVEVPSDLTPEVRAVWESLAPHATAARTLVPSMMLAFRDLCEAIVFKRRLMACIEKDGLTTTKTTLKMEADGGGEEIHERKAHPLITQYRGLMQRVEAGLLRFRLSPMGKEIVTVEEPKDEWAEFDGPAVN